MSHATQFNAVATQPFPTFVMLNHTVDDAFVWKGDIALAKLPRILAESVADEANRTEDTVFLEVSLCADARSDDIYRLTINAATSIDLVCQRCLHVFAQTLSVHVSIALIGQSNTQTILADDEDFMLLQDIASYDARQGLNILALVEDELLLSLPISPKHEQCDMAVTSVGEIEETDEEADNPFSVLASLKGKL